jgi:hypothetical protein
MSNYLANCLFSLLRDTFLTDGHVEDGEYSGTCGSFPHILAHILAEKDIDIREWLGA